MEIVPAGAVTAVAGSELTAANAAVGLRVHASGSGEHTGAGKLLGWKVGGVRHGDTSGGALPMCLCWQFLLPPRPSHAHTPSSCAADDQ